MKLLFAILFTTLYGVSVRLLFGFFDGFMGIMSVTFLFLVPLIIGFLTVILLPYKKENSATGAFFKPWVTCLVILIVTILFQIEGTICWVMIFPVFAVIAGFGGIIAHNMKKRRFHVDDEMDIDKEDWDKPNTLKISLLVFIPLFVGFLEGDRVLTPKEMTLSKDVVLAAPPAVVWQQLLTINNIQSKERHRSFSSVLGFPHHLYTSLDTPVVGGKRVAVYEKGLLFVETISAYQPQHLMALRIQTDPAKIPLAVMDEHIVIGGKHVDILEDIYQLQALPDGKCRLSLSSRFYINTPFNWYAGIWAHYLMADILQGELNLIQQRVADLSKEQITNGNEKRQRAMSKKQAKWNE